MTFCKNVIIYQNDCEGLVWCFGSWSRLERWCTTGTSLRERGLLQSRGLFTRQRETSGGLDEGKNKCVAASGALYVSVEWSMSSNTSQGSGLLYYFFSCSTLSSPSYLFIHIVLIVHPAMFNFPCLLPAFLFSQSANLDWTLVVVVTHKVDVSFIFFSLINGVFLCSVSIISLEKNSFQFQAKMRSPYWGIFKESLSSSRSFTTSWSI